VLQVFQLLQQLMTIMNGHRYILEPYNGMSTRHSCPECNSKGKTFSRYIDKETGEHLYSTVGRCNRESKCGYHYTPRQYSQDNDIPSDKLQPRINPQPSTLHQQKFTSIPVGVFKGSLKEYESNNFVSYLITLFGTDIVSELVSRYFIGSSKRWKGATVFWQIDINGRIRTGKIMLYDADTGRRIKQPYNHINWVHKALKRPHFELKQCLFGEHLLKDKTKPVAVVESEKTAVIASAYLPQFIWLAAGSLSNLNAEKCGVLKGRKVILFPDLNGFERWNKKAKELSTLATYTVSNLLERKASVDERNQGLDIADYLVKFDPREFIPVETELSELQPHQYNQRFSRSTRPNWDKEITELEKYYAGVILPSQEVKLNEWTTILDTHKFVNSHFATVKENNGNPVFLPYMERLNELIRVLNNGNLIG